MSSFLYSFLAHFAVAAAVVTSASMPPSQSEIVQVQIVQTQKPQLIAKVPVKRVQVAAQAPAKDVAPEATEKNTQEPSQESVINLQQAGSTSDRVFSYLVTQIYKNRIYPYESIRLKQQGHVTLSFYINEAGELTDISMLQPSDYKQLNSAAVRTLKTLKLSKEVPNVEMLFKRRYSFTFDFELVKTL